jgi:hypothetical protein
MRSRNGTGPQGCMKKSHEKYRYGRFMRLYSRGAGQRDY